MARAIDAERAKVHEHLLRLLHARDSCVGRVRDGHFPSTVPESTEQFHVFLDDQLDRARSAGWRSGVVTVVWVVTLAYALAAALVICFITSG